MTVDLADPFEGMNPDAAHWSPDCRHPTPVDTTAMCDVDRHLYCEGCGATWTEER